MYQRTVIDMTNTNLWWATKKPDMSIECHLRAARVFSFLIETTPPVMYKDIRRELGISYAQTIRAVGLLCSLDLATVTVTAHWNGCYYVYPHRVWITGGENGD